jgi:hypothetical protein
VFRSGRLGNGLGNRSRWRRFEAGGDLSAPDSAPEDVGVFVLGDLDGLVQGLSQIGEGGGGFGLEVTLRDSGEDTAQGGAEIAGGKVISEKERRYILTSLFRGLRLRFLLGVERAEMQVAGAARSAALAAIGKGESTQTGTVFFRFMGDRRAVFSLTGRKTDVFLCARKTDFILCGRKTANGAVRGHGSLLRIERFEL